MADENATTDSPSSGAGDTQRTKKGYTAPKGRPTRGRDDLPINRRAFGPVAQWITVAIAVLVIVVIIILVTGGGDFNPFRDLDTAPFDHLVALPNPAPSG